MIVGSKHRDDAIYAYTKAGFVLFPCGQTSNPKAPKHRGWQQTPYNALLTPSDLPPIYGMVIPDGVIVVDCDPRRFVAGVDQLEQLWRQLKLPVPETFTVKTGGGGLHLYFRCPSGFRAAATVPGYPALDLKGVGGYVCAAGSLHESGEMYLVQSGDISKLMDMPQVLLEYVKRKVSTADISDAEPIIDDSKNNQDRFVQLLTSIEPSGSFKTACFGRDFGLSSQTVFDLMLEHWNPRRQDPHSEGELKTKVRNAFSYAQNSQGCKHPSSDFAGINTGGKGVYELQRINYSISTISAAKLIQKQFPAPRWAVPPILPEGVTIIAGPPKVGKSWMAYSLACAVASGGRALASYPSRQGVVLYLALEDNQRRLQERLNRLAAGENRLASEHLLLSCDIPRFDNGGLQALEKWLDDHPECRMVIIDTLGRFSPAPNGKMNAYDNDCRALGPMQKLAITRQIALVLVTHLRKQSSSDALERVMGSTGITGAADAIWLLKRGRGEGNGILTVTGRDVEEQELAVQFEKATCQWTVLGDAEKYQLDKKRQEILNCLEQATEPVGPKEMAEALGRKEVNIKNLMRKMHQSGQIGKVSRGEYVALKINDDFGYLRPESHANTEL